MMRFFLALLLLLSATAKASDDLVLNFDHVTVVDLIKVVYGDILKKDFVLSPELVDKPETVTMNFRKISREDLSDYMRTLLESINVRMEEKMGRMFFKPKPNPLDVEKELFFYRPKYRSAEYITDLLSSLFDNGRFSFQRGVKIGAGSNPSTSGAVPVADSNQGKNVPNATSGYSGGGMSGNSMFSSMNDKTIDSFVFEGTPSDVEKLKKLVAQIDTPNGEILVKGIVYEVGDISKSGSAVGLAVQLLNKKLGMSVGTFKGLGDVARLTIGGSAANVEALFTALSEDSRFKVVSSPSVRVQSGKTAGFISGADVPVLGAVQTDRNGNAIPTVTYKPAGVILSIRPDVRQEQIVLDIKQEISSFTGTTSGVNQSPTFSKREVSTTVGVVSDEVIVIGGLTEEKASKGRSGFPFLPEFLHSKNDETSKSEILLVLQVQKI